MNLPEPTNDIPALEGSLLLADPSLHGGAFDHSVILISQHSPDQGAFGLVLNHPTGNVVGDLLKDDQFHHLRHIAVHQGGPVNPHNLFFSALWWEPKTGIRIVNQISAEEATKHTQKPGTLVRAFVGYSGWSPGQLENELKRNSWIVTQPSTKIMSLNHDRSLWADTLRGISPYHKLLAEAPKNPFNN
jgi:putative transcriptional regulator